jgi:hypothetical protein
MEEAKIAGLMNKDNWKKYPKNMVKHRATAFAFREAFPDILSGCYDSQEMQDIDEVEKDKQPKNITPPIDVITKTQLEELEDLLKQTGEVEKWTNKILTKQKIEKLDDVDSKKYEAIKSHLQKIIENNVVNEIEEQPKTEEIETEAEVEGETVQREINEYGERIVPQAQTEIEF